MRDTYNLQRFIDAQEPIYEDVLNELKLGRKSSHWMWYIFPQIKGLGRSWTAQEFAISSLEEAEAYLKNPILGSRLRQCTQLVLNIEGRKIKEIFGYPDYLKFRSSMTLFFYATKDNQIFKDALLKYFESKPDRLTLDILKRY
ncbi:MAG: DUF1810 domain-containing protein [Xenococcaceae cyanobacterium]